MENKRIIDALMKGATSGAEPQIEDWDYIPHGGTIPDDWLRFERKPFGFAVQRSLEGLSPKELRAREKK